MQSRTEPLLATTYLLGHDSGNRQTVEHIVKGIPQLDIVAPPTFIVKAVDSVFGGALVLNSNANNVRRIRETDTLCSEVVPVSCSCRRP